MRHKVAAMEEAKLLDIIKHQLVVAPTKEVPHKEEPIMRHKEEPIMRHKVAVTEEAKPVVIIKHLQVVAPIKEVHPKLITKELITKELITKELITKELITKKLIRPSKAVATEVKQVVINHHHTKEEPNKVVMEEAKQVDTKKPVLGQQSVEVASLVATGDQILVRCFTNNQLQLCHLMRPLQSEEGIKIRENISCM